MDDDAMRIAAALTAKQLEKAIEIVEDELGADVEHKHAPLVAAALLALAHNYRADHDGGGRQRSGVIRSFPRPS